LQALSQKGFELQYGVCQNHQSIFLLFLFKDSGTKAFLPQLQLHFEIDEPFHKKQVDLDVNRETDIIQSTDHQIRRIKITEDLDSINKQIANLIVEIKAKIEILENNKQWESWDLDKEFNPNYYREKGYLDVEENPAFRKIVDACNCLGQNY
jgi:hypothetical protein